MDVKEAGDGDQSSECWTNERHIRYLNSMEASFVRTMFSERNRHRRRLLPLDRYLPDTSDSTLDLKKQPPKRPHHRHQIVTSGLLNEKKTRRQSSHPHVSSTDQVVPQLEFEKDLPVPDVPTSIRRPPNPMN